MKAKTHTLFTKIITWVVAINFMCTNISWAGGIMPDEAYKLAAGTRLGDIIRVAEDVYLNDAIVTACLEHGVNTNRDILERRGEIEAGVTSDRARDVAYGILGSQTDPQARAFYLVNNDLEGGRFYIHRYSHPGAADDPFYRAIGEFIRPEVKMDEVREINGVRLRHQVVSIPQEVREFVLSLIPLFPGQMSFYKSLANPSQDAFQPIDLWNRYFGVIGRLAGNTQEVTIAFDRGRFGSRIFRVKIPHERLLAQDPGLRDMVFRYLSIYIYNRLGAIGAERVLINHAGKASIAESPLCQALSGRFNFDRTRIEEVDRDPNYPDRPYKKINNYLSGVYETGFSFEYADLSRIDALTPEVQIPQQAFNKNTGEVIGVDIGGSDIKVVAMRNGELTFYEEESWSPSGFASADMHIGVIRRLIDKARQDGGLSKIDSIGISVNLAVNNERIADGPLTDGIRGNAAEMERIKNLRDVITGIYGVPVAVANDGDMAAMWAYHDMGMKDVLCLSFGTGLAGGYVNEDGNITNVLGEMGNIVINMNPRGAGHHITMMAGAAAAYLSQRPIIKPGRLAEKKGIVLQGANDKAKLAHAQHLLAHGTQDEQRKMEEIFAEIGEYLAAFAVESHNYFGMKEVLIMGRVTEGRGGDILKARAEEILRRDYPNLGITIRFPNQPGAGKPQDLYKKFGQAIGAAYLGSQKLQNLPKAQPLTSGRDVRWRSPDAIDTRAGNLDAVIRELESNGISSDFIQNLTDGYREALDIVCRRFGVESARLTAIPIQIVSAQERAAQIDSDKITLVFEILDCKERVVRELVEEFDHAVNNPRTDFDRACHELRTDIEEVLYFHRLSAEEQALYLFSLFSPVVDEPTARRGLGLDIESDRDKSFYTLLVRSYKDRDKFQDLIGTLEARYGLIDEDREVLDYFQAEEQAGVFDLCLAYGRDNTIYPDDIRDVLTRTDPGGIVVSLLSFYNERDPAGNFQKNYELLLQGMYSGNKLAMFDAVLEEAVFIGRPIEQIVGGIIDSGVYSREEYEQESARAPPSYEMVYIGGGGWHATDFVWTLVKQSADIKKKIAGRIAGGVYAAADDGGRGRPFIDALREHPDYMRYLVNMADIGVVLFWATGEPAKLQMIYEDNTVTRAVNVNMPLDMGDAEQRTRYKATLMEIYGMDEALADKIISYKRSGGDFNPDNFRALLLGYFTTVAPGGDTAMKLASRIKAQTRFRGGSLASFEDIIAGRISVVRNMMEQGAPYRQRGYYTRPRDILFFISNVLNLARLCDREFMDTGISPLIKDSTMNLFNYAALLACGIVNKGTGGNPAEIDTAKTLGLFHEALGVDDARLAVSTLDEGTLAAVTEAVSIKIGGDVVIIGEQEGKTWLTAVPKDHYTKVKTVHLDSPGKREVTSSGVDMDFNVYDENGQVVSTVRARFIKGEGREIIVRIEGADVREVMVLTEEEQEGMTVVKIGDISRRVNTVAKWEPYKVGGTTVEVRSRLIIEQTAITDADETFPAHPAPIVKQVWKKVETDGDGNVVYAKDDQGRVILDGENEIKRRVYRDLRDAEEVPGATPAALSTIRNARKVIVSGMGSMFTSILPNFMCKGIAQAVKERTDIARVYVVKAVTDIETAGLSIREQMLRFEESLRGIPGCEGIKLEDLFTHVVLPKVPSDMREYLLSARDKSLKKLVEEARQKGGKPKLSKIPFGFQELTEEDIAFFKERGIEMVEVSYFTEHRKIKKGEVAITSSIHYGPEHLADVLDMIGDSYRLKRQMIKGNLREAADAVFPDRVSLPREPLFWPMHVWHDVFEKFNRDALARPAEYDNVVITLDQGEGESSVYRLSIPRNIPDEELGLIARYIAIYIYNRLATVGAKRVFIRCKTPLFNAVRDRFKSSNLGKIFRFLSDVYDTDFKLILDTGLRTARPVTGAVSTQPAAVDPKKGMLMGMSIGEEEIRWTILKDGQRHSQGIRGWTKYEIENVANFHNLILDVINNAVSNLGRGEKLDCIGIAWPGPVVDGRIRTTTYVLGKLGAEEFRDGLVPLGEVISQKLGDTMPQYQGIPVVIVNDGNAQGFRETVETGEKDFLALGMRGSIPASLVRDGDLVDVLSEVGNLHIDMSMGAARHRITNVSGALQQYLTKDGVRRLGRRLLMGNLSYREMVEVFTYIVEDVVRERNGDFASLGMTPSEFYNLCDCYADLQGQDVTHGEKGDRLAKFIGKFSAGRVSGLLGVESGILERILLFQKDAEEAEIDAVTEKVRGKVRGNFGLIEAIANEVSQRLAEEIVQLHGQYRMHNILIPGRILGVSIGSDVCKKTEAILKTRGLTPEVSIFLNRRLTYIDVINKLQRGDPYAKRVFSVIGNYLAEALEELYAVYHPKKIVVYGDILQGKAGEIAIRVAKDRLRERAVERRRLGPSEVGPELEDVEIALTRLDWTAVGHAEAIGAAYLANNRILPTQVLVESRLAGDRGDDVLNEYRAEDKLDARVVILQRLRSLLKTERGELRERARVVLGRIIGIPIQNMFAYENRAREVKIRYIGDEDIKIDGISRRILIMEIIESCLLESPLSNVHSSARWAIDKIREHEAADSGARRPHSGAVSETGRTLTTVTIDGSGNIVGEYEEIPDKGLLMELLRRLIELYGPGILGVTKEIEIVEGDSLSFYNTKVQIGINRFRSKAELFEGLEHEFLESVTTLIQPNKGYGETTILYRNIKRFLNPPEGFDKAEYQRDILRGFSEGYRRVLERLLELEREGRLTDSLIISSIVRYIIGTGLYTEEDFGMDKATWIETVKQTETRLEAALEVYDSLVGARRLVVKRVNISIPDSILTRIFPMYWGQSPDMYGYTEQQAARKEVEHARKEFTRIIRAFLRRYSPDDLANKIFATTSKERIRVPDSILTRIFPMYWGQSPDMYGYTEQQAARKEVEHARREFHRVCRALRRAYKPDELAQKILDAAVLEKGLEPVGKKVVEGVRRTERAILRRVKTFTGKIRIDGLNSLPPAIVRAVDVIGEISRNTAAIQAEALRLIDAKEKKPQKYIWLDKAKEEVLTGNLRTEWDRIKEELQRMGFGFVYNKPDGVVKGDIIRLVDPSDLNRLEKNTDTLYLSIPYMRASLYIAAEVVLAEGDVDSLMDSLSIRLITELYEQLLGRDVTRDDLIRLFTQPWYILSEIEGIISDLNRLSEAAELFEVAA